jgi:hypothetical protein
VFVLTEKAKSAPTIIVNKLLETRKNTVGGENKKSLKIFINALNEIHKYVYANV